MTAQFAIVVPTFNERENVAAVLESVKLALPDGRWELVFVDDNSPDGTAQAVRELAQSDSRVRCVQRLGRRGLSSACIEGILASNADCIAVMDADLQHDPALLPEMLTALDRDQVDLAIGSRYLLGGGSAGGLSEQRQLLSRMATRFAKPFMRHAVSDPMSGYFAVRRHHFERCMQHLSGKGFKILLDILMASPRDTRIREFPYQMRARRHGETKLDSIVVLEYFLLIADKLVGRVIPARFVLFVLVGLSGMAVHLAILALLFRGYRLDFELAQIGATLVAMTSNFLLNNEFTYRDQRIRGLGLIRGLGSFYLACSLGMAVNVFLANYIFQQSVPWWLSGILGAGVASVWNFAVTSVLTWNRSR